MRCGFALGWMTATETLAVLLMTASAAGLAGASAGTTHPFGPAGIKIEVGRGGQDTLAFGNSVALSADGSAGLVGDAAAAAVVTRNSAGWAKQAELVLPGIDPRSIDSNKPGSRSPATAPLRSSAAAGARRQQSGSSSGAAPPGLNRRS